jgi:hypothetical protein
MHSESRDGAKVIWLAVHTTEGIMRAVDLRAWTAWAGSSHASNDETGVLLSGAGDGFVDYSRAAWTLRAANPISDNLEQCGWARWTRAEWLARPKLLDATARWLADRSKARGIPLVHLSLADIKARKPGVIGHADYTYATGDGTHTDPGPNYPWDVVIAKARAYAGQAPQEDDMPLSEDDLRKLHDAVWWGVSGAKLIPNELTGGGEWAKTTLGSMTARIGRDVVAPQIAGLTAAVSTLAQAVAGGRDDLTAEELTAAVDEGIRRGGAAVLAAQNAARAANPTS